MLSLLLLISSIGITVHKHYCDNKLISSSILPHHDGCDDGMPMKTNSCRDVHHHFGIDIPFFSQIFTVDVTPIARWISPFEVIINLNLTEQVTIQNPIAENIPHLSEPGIVTWDQSFLL